MSYTVGHSCRHIAINKLLTKKHNITFKRTTFIISVLISTYIFFCVFITCFLLLVCCYDFSLVNVLSNLCICICNFTLKFTEISFLIYNSIVTITMNSWDCKISEKLQTVFSAGINLKFKSCWTDCIYEVKPLECHHKVIIMSWKRFQKWRFVWEKTSQNTICTDGKLVET